MNGVYYRIDFVVVVVLFVFCEKEKKKKKKEEEEEELRFVRSIRYYYCDKAHRNVPTDLVCSQFK